MKRSVVLGCLALAVGCGSGVKKINYAKMDASKRIALVGVCQLYDVAVTRGMDATRADIGGGLIEAIGVGLDKALPTAWKSVQITPLASVAANPALPPHGKYGERRCARGLDPFLPKGHTGDPDRAYLAQVAKALDVDAVMMVTSNLGVRFAGDKVRAYNGSLNPLYIYIVDRNGEQIAVLSIKGLDSENVPMATDDVLFPALGSSYGFAVAQEFVRRLNDR